MELAPERVGPYLAALRAGLFALAPNEDFPPLRAMLDHLDALHPDRGGRLLLPAEVDDRSGLPAFAWMERAVAEQIVAQGAPAPYEAPAPGAALARDPELAQRLRWRQDLHAHLRQAELLPPSRLVAQVRRLRPTTDFTLCYDRLVAGAGWMRLRADLSGPAGWQGDLLRLRADDTVVLDPGLRHLLARHAVVPLLALHAWLGQNLAVELPRLARSWVGPFWFPGPAQPEGVPDALRGGLVLHLSSEVVGRDVRKGAHRDPWVPPHVGEVIPPGFQVFRERRFAVTPGLVPAARAWAAARGCDVVVVPLLPRGA